MSEFNAIIFDNTSASWLCFDAPLKAISTHEISEVLPTLRAIESKVKREGLWAVGWISYEAAPAFDDALICRQPLSDLPLVWFGLYKDPTPHATLPEGGKAAQIHWLPTVSEQDYHTHLSEVRKKILAGDTYQVNFSFRLQAEAPAEPYDLFRSMVESQRGAYSAYIDSGRFVVCSASPELFFERNEKKITCRPMKGTALRGLHRDDDHIACRELQNSVKERAENVMIVDMVRNDLSRIAEPESVAAPSLCKVERYPHMLQLVSEVHAYTSVPTVDVIKALFPCASVTGAPKPSTMGVIAALENTPRGVYTGALGVLSPHNRDWFNVPIRTALIDRTKAQVTYGTGSGVVWDSTATNEYKECLLKAYSVVTPCKDFTIFETILWEPGHGLFLHDRHIERLQSSAQYFGWRINDEHLRATLAELREVLDGTTAAQRVKISMHRSGRCDFVVQPLSPLPTPYRVALATEAVDSQNRYLYHKTSERTVYDSAIPSVPEADDVILWNERGELTETRIANIVLEIDESLYTPPIQSGLLAGCYRSHLITAGSIRERVLVTADLQRASRIFLINSLRRMWVADYLPCLA